MPRKTLRLVHPDYSTSEPLRRTYRIPKRGGTDIILEEEVYSHHHCLFPQGRPDLSMVIYRRKPGRRTSFQTFLSREIMPWHVDRKEVEMFIDESQTCYLPYDYHGEKYVFGRSFNEKGKTIGIHWKIVKYLKEADFGVEEDVIYQHGLIVRRRCYVIYLFVPGPNPYCVELLRLPRFETTADAPDAHRVFQNEHILSLVLPATLDLISQRDYVAECYRDTSLLEPVY